MRFTTEFELEAGTHAKIIEACKGRYCLDLGNIIAESFGWNNNGQCTIDGPIKERFAIEIEAFPMGKWVEFRKRFLAALPDYDNTSRIRLENALHDLESFGKPTGDTITNPK